MSKYFKYPRTFHLPKSPGTTSDDRLLKSTDQFKDIQIVGLEKLDGENTNMYRDHIHARSLDSSMHASRTLVKQMHGEICHEIPDGYRICGENMFAKHSIFYNSLTSYFYVFAIFNDKNECLSWDETKEWTKLLNLETVPELYRGSWDEEAIHQTCWTGISKFGPEQEGYVVRNAFSFPYSSYAQNVAKWVRPKHVRTSQFWMNEPLVPNLKIS